MYMYQNSLKYKYHIQIIFNVDSIAISKFHLWVPFYLTPEPPRILSMYNEPGVYNITSSARIDAVEPQEWIIWPGHE